MLANRAKPAVRLPPMRKPCKARCLPLVAVALLRCVPEVGANAPYPKHSGPNRVSWPNGCCEGDHVIIDFRDEQADGNGGSGMLYINNTAVTPNTIEHYRIGGEHGYLWKSYGPFCAYEGWHNMSYTSDANADETSFTISDSFGLIKAHGGMDAFPVTFHTLQPSKFCTPAGGLNALQQRQRNRKLIAAHDQYTPRDRLLAEGFGVPQDTSPPLTVYNNNGTHVDRALARRLPPTATLDRPVGSGAGNGGNLY